MPVLMRMLAVAVIAGIHGPGLAQQAPGPDDISEALGLGMPSYWGVNKVVIQASVNDGDDISPRYRQRFTAEVAPHEVLYRLVDEVEPFRIVAEVSPAGKSYRLFGIGSSVLEKGRWVTKLQMENSVASLGKPQSMFDGPVIIAGAEGSQQEIEAFLQGRETANTLAERMAVTAANADVLAKLAAEADAQERALLKDIYRRRLEALKGRIDANLSDFGLVVDTMITDNRETLAQIEALHKQKIANMKARAETQLAIAEANREAASLDELATALEALNSKRRHAVDLEARVVETRVAAEKKRYDLLIAKLSSADVSEQLAAFTAAISSEDDNLRRLALSVAFQSDSNDLQGAALAAYIASKPQMSLTVTYSKDGKVAGTYVQALRVTDVNGASFVGQFSTPGMRMSAKGNGTIQGDNLSFNVQSQQSGRCSWSARINRRGVLGGRMQCVNRNGKVSTQSPPGEASVTF